MKQLGQVSSTRKCSFGTDNSCTDWEATRGTRGKDAVGMILA